MQYYFTGDENATYRWDLGARTDGQPVYSGKLENPPSNLTSAQLEDLPLWRIHYFEYTTIAIGDILTSRKIATGKWSGRAGLTYR